MQSCGLLLLNRCYIINL